MSEPRRAPWDPPRREWGPGLSYAGAALVFWFLHWITATLFFTPPVDTLSFRLAAAFLMAVSLVATASAIWWSINYIRKH